MSKQYTRKPIKVEAIQWTGDNIDDFNSIEGFRSLIISPLKEMTIKKGKWVEGIYRNSKGNTIAVLDLTFKDWGDVEVVESSFLIIKKYDGCFSYSVMDEVQFKEEYEEAEGKQINYDSRVRKSHNITPSDRFDFKVGDLINMEDIDFSYKCKTCGVILMHADGNYSCASYYHDGNSCKEEAEGDEKLTPEQETFKEGLTKVMFDYMKSNLK